MFLVPMWSRGYGATNVAALAAGGGGDVTAPTLTNATASQLAETTGSLSVDTDEANGTLYYVVVASSSTPSAAQVKAGQDSSGASAKYSGNQAIASSGTKTATATGLAPNATYYANYMHEDAATNQSSVAHTSAFITMIEFIGPTGSYVNGRRKQDWIIGGTYLVGM